MSNYYYLGLAEMEYGFTTQKVLIAAYNGHYLTPGNAVSFYAQGRQRVAEVTHVAFVQEGSDEEAVMTALAPVYTAEKIYTKSWFKNEEEENNGN